MLLILPSCKIGCVVDNARNSTQYTLARKRISILYFNIAVLTFVISETVRKKVRWIVHTGCLTMTYLLCTDLLVQKINDLTNRELDNYVKGEVKSGR